MKTINLEIFDEKGHRTYSATHIALTDSFLEFLQEYVMDNSREIDEDALEELIYSEKEEKVTT